MNLERSENILQKIISTMDYDKCIACRGKEINKKTAKNYINLAKVIFEKYL